MNKAQHLVGEGFPAGLAEMEVNIKCRAANGLYHIGRRRVRGGGMALSSLLVLLLPSGAGMMLVFVMLGSFVIGSPFIVHQS